jgi:hypothetical protein
MQVGIGRGGYRALGYVFCGLGLVGLLMVALGGGGATLWIGLLLSAAGLLALTGLVTVALGLPPGAARPARPAPRGAPDEEAPVPLPTPEPPAAPDPGADLGFEYGDAVEPAPVAAAPVAVAAPSPWAADPAPSFEAEQPMLVPAARSRSLPPPPPRPAATTPPPRMARPHASSAPPAGKSTVDSGWPERRGKAGVTRRQLAESSGVGPPPSRRDLPRDPGPAVKVEGPGPARREPPIVMAKTVASAEATGIPEGTGIGKCGNCGVLLLAPKKRPIRLQCPRCERVHLLP